MSSLWDTRFRDQTNLEDPIDWKLNSSDQITISDVMASLGDYTPLINEERLTKVDSLGRGNTFQVDRAIYKDGLLSYYVAVKHALNKDTTTKQSQRRAMAINRELRTLLNPQLRYHGGIVHLLGYGWTLNSPQELCPYLVMEYSPYGTLRHFLSKHQPKVEERWDLALDIAQALTALHGCGIVHGDVKLENTLVTDVNDFHERNQSAKLADFGCAIYKDDLTSNSETYYLGTALYNAPEVMGRKVPNNQEWLDDFESFTHADCYSFGLSLLEIMLNGEMFLAGAAKLYTGEKTQEILTRMTESGADSVLKLAQSKLERRIGKTVEPSFLKRISEALDLCLPDDGRNRANMVDIAEKLSENLTTPRPRIRFPMPKVLPHATGNHVRPFQKTIKDPYQLRLLSTDFSVRVLDPGEISMLEPPVRVSSYPPSKTNEMRYQEHTYKVFQVFMGKSLPWPIQRQLGEQLKHDVAQQTTSSQKIDWQLLLAAMYHYGFGFCPEQTEVLYHLSQAAEKSTMAQFIHARIEAALMALEPVLSRLKNTEPSETAQLFVSVVKPRSGLVNDLADHGITRRGATSLAEFCHLSSLKPLAGYTLEEQVSIDIRKNNIHQFELNLILTAACRNGDFDVAMALMPHCFDYAREDDSATPLHWLVSFSPAHAKRLLIELVIGRNGSLSNRSGICRDHLNSSCSEPTTVSECCIDLIGTPLHWAVRTGYKCLVEELIRLGADFNKRWERPLVFNAPASHMPNYSPLDLAVTYHFFDIVQFLLSLGADFFGGDPQWTYSAFHMIGHIVDPFARYIIHGQGCRAAVAETIRVLLSWNLNINDRDSLGRTPLLCAIKNIDLERYVLEELLVAGARVEGIDLVEDEPIATVIAMSCSDRRFVSWKFSLLLDQIPEINALDAYGRNALHYCAMFDGVKVAKIILAQPGVEVDLRASDVSHHTALMYAASFGSVEVARLLLEAHASIELSTKHFENLLDMAVYSRHVEIARLLFNAGAKPIFAESRNTILHRASMTAKNRTSIVADMLRILPDETVSILLNARNADGLTPLQNAILFVDIVSVKALLQAGAYTSVEYGFGCRTPLQYISREIEIVLEQRGYIPFGDPTPLNDVLAMEEIKIMLARHEHV